MTSLDGSVVEKVNDHRGDLEAIAETDLPCAKYAEELLALIDETGGDR